MSRKAQLKVIKTDGSLEDYFHTKVLGAVSHAMSTAGDVDIDAVENLADVVTYFIYRQSDGRHSIRTGEIFSIIQACLTVSQYYAAAAAFSEYQFRRRLKRCRVEVVDFDLEDLADAQAFCDADKSIARLPWNKSIIAKYLVEKHQLNWQTARMVASMVEERVFGMGISVVPSSLTKQIVLGDAAAVLHAEHQLETV